MSRVVRGATAAMFALVLGLAAVAPAQAATDVSDVGDQALKDVASCVSEKGALLAAIVVDESSSLNQTDPDDQRFDALETVLQSLESLAVDSDVDVEANIATFGKRYDEIEGWGDVTGSHGEALEHAVATELPARELVDYTDYRVALDGARDSINGRAADRDGDECRLMLWFTDGKLDVDNTRDTKSAENVAAFEDLCTEGGIVDGVREDDIAIAALALFVEGNDAPTSKDRARLQAIAEGKVNGAECGENPIPEDWATGVYLRAENADTLGAVFAQAGAQIEGGLPGAPDACTGEVCVLPMDPGVLGGRIVVDGSLKAGSVRATSPDGAAAKLKPGKVKVGDATVTTSEEDGFTLIDLDVPPSAKAGNWTFDLGKDDVEASVYYFWGVDLEVGLPTTIINGTSTEVPVTLTSRTGDAVDPAVYSSYDLTVTVNGEEVPVAGDKKSFTLSVPDSEASAPLDVEARASAVSSPTGIELGPISSGTVGAQTLSASYPTIVTPTIDFGHRTEPTGVPATLTVQGSDKGPTEACVTDMENVTGPEQAGALSVVASPADCVQIPQGESREISFELTSEDVWEGNLGGDVQVTIKGNAEAPAVTVDVPVEGSMERVVNHWVQAALTIALVLLALIIAWLTALIGRHFADRFRFGPGAQSARVPVEITSAGLVRVDGKTPELIDAAEDFHRVSTIGNSKTTASADVAGLQYRRIAPFNPWRSARGVVSAPGAIVAHGEHAETVKPDGSLAPAPFPGTTGFVLVADPLDIQLERVKADLVMVVEAPDGVSSVLPDRLADLRQVQWSEVLIALNAAALALAEKAAADTPVERELSRRVGGGGGSGTPAAPDFTGADDAGASYPSGSVPTSDWLLPGEQSAPIPPADDPGKRCRRKTGGSSRKPKSTPSSDTPPRADQPPPAPDFLS